MQAIRQTALLNKRELENATPPSASWHADYRDTAWIYVGGLPLDLSEGDVCIIFSQFGNPTHLNMIRDKETGKSKGFGFLKYEDQRSCDLAVDNLGGSEVLGRMLRVDHTRYKKRDGEDEETYLVETREKEQFGKKDGEGDETDVEGGDDGKRKKRRKLLKEEVELEQLLAITADGEEEDPMRHYLIREKKAEVEEAKAKEKERRKHKHRRRHHKDPNEESRDGKNSGSKQDEEKAYERPRHRPRDDDSDYHRQKRDERHSRRPSR
jgi:RNA-binding motif protein, X-linked 2